MIFYVWANESPRVFTYLLYFKIYAGQKYRNFEKIRNIKNFKNKFGKNQKISNFESLEHLKQKILKILKMSNILETILKIKNQKIPKSKFHFWFFIDKFCSSRFRGNLILSSPSCLFYTFVFLLQPPPPHTNP